MRKILLGMALLALTGCGGAATPATGGDTTGAQTSPVASAPVASAPASAAPSESALPSASPAGGGIETVGGTKLGGGSGDIEAQMVGFLASQIGKPADTLKLQSKEKMEWSDGSMGCPDPAALYMQVITPGYKLTYSDGTTTYDVRANEAGNIAVWCQDGKPTTIGQP